MPRPAFDRFNGDSPEMRGALTQTPTILGASDTGGGGRAKHPMEKKLNRRCDDFCAQLLTLKEIFSGQACSPKTRRGAWRPASSSNDGEYRLKIAGPSHN